MLLTKAESRHKDIQRVLHLLIRYTEKIEMYFFCFFVDSNDIDDIELRVKRKRGERLFSSINLQTQLSYSLETSFTHNPNSGHLLLALNLITAFVNKWSSYSADCEAVGTLFKALKKINMCEIKIRIIC